MTDLTADRAAALSLTPVSRETLRRLDRFVETLLTWQQRINLISPATVPQLWTRHVADSLQLIPLAPDARIWVDMGSGGGFPGLVIGCALADTPGAMVHLIESNGKKVAFLRAAARLAGAAAIVHAGRITQVIGNIDGRIGVVTARAVAPLADLLALSEPLLKRGAKALFPKGQDVGAELTQSSRYWNIEAMLVPSLTDPRARIVAIERAGRRADSRP